MLQSDLGPSSPEFAVPSGEPAERILEHNFSRNQDIFFMRLNILLDKTNYFVDISSPSSQKTLCPVGKSRLSASIMANSKMTVAQIKDELDSRKIAYPSRYIEFSPPLECFVPLFRTPSRIVSGTHSPPEISVAITLAPLSSFIMHLVTRG